MKIKTLIYVLVLIGIIACDKDKMPVSVDSESHILFSYPNVLLESGLQTRSKITGTSLPENSSFGVWGYCVAYSPGTSNVEDVSSASSEWALKQKLCPPTLFDSGSDDNMLEVTVSSNGCSYNDNTHSGAKPWLENENSLYTFVAVYPTSASGLEFSFKEQNSAAVDAPKIIYTVPYSGTVEPSDYKDTPDIMVAWRENHRKADGHVPLTFYHLMSSLSVRINNYSEYYDENNELKGKKLFIHSIKLQGKFHKTLTIDMADNGAYSFNDYYEAIYVLYEDDGDGYYVPFSDDQETVDTDETSVILGEPLMLLCGKPGVDQPYGPESKDKVSGIKLILEYTFGEGSERKTASLNLLNPDLSFSPQVGVNYTFQVNWIGDGLVLLVMPSSNAQWGDGEADDTNTGNDDIVFE